MRAQGAARLCCCTQRLGQARFKGGGQVQQNQRWGWEDCTSHELMMRWLREGHL